MQAELESYPFCLNEALNVQVRHEFTSMSQWNSEYYAAFHAAGIQGNMLFFDLLLLSASFCLSGGLREFLSNRCSISPWPSEELQAVVVLIPIIVSSEQLEWKKRQSSEVSIRKFIYIKFGRAEISSRYNFLVWWLPLFPRHVVLTGVTTFWTGLCL